MGWRSSSSKERVTVDYLLERQVSLEWQEAVALVLEVAEMLERDGRALPATRSVALTPAGSVEFLSGRAESGEPVGRLAEMLNALLPEERPTQLRLIGFHGRAGRCVVQVSGGVLRGAAVFRAARAPQSAGRGVRTRPSGPASFRGG